MVTWWSSPIDRVNLTVFTSFDQRDLVPVGYAAFAFALGAAAGLSSAAPYRPWPPRWSSS